MPSKRQTKRVLPDAEKQRRRRLLAETQGRRLDEAYLSHPNIRVDVEAEAAGSNPDALVTPDMLAHLQELIEERHLVVNEGAVPRVSPGAGSGQEGTAAGRTVLDAITGEACEGASEPRRGAGRAAGLGDLRPAGVLQHRRGGDRPRLPGQRPGRHGGRGVRPDLGRPAPAHPR